jgi:hypothetical protein
MVSIYGLYDKKDNVIKYVGKTNKLDIKKRLKEHINETFRNKNRSHKINWIRSVINNNGEIDIKLLETTTETEWQDREKYWIKKYKISNNLTNTTNGGDLGGHGTLYNISYDDCKKYIQNNLNIKSKVQWRKNIIDIPEFIPKEPRLVYLKRGWISWGDFLGSNNTQDNLKAKKYISYDEAKLYIKKLNIKTIVDWKNRLTEIPENIPNRPDRFYKKRGWVSWGDFLGTGRIANQNKKYTYLSYDDAKNYIQTNNIKSISDFKKYKLPENIPSHPHKIYKEWTNWGTFFGTGYIQDNKISSNYLSYYNAKQYILNNLSHIRTEKMWKEYIKNNTIKIIPNHPELYYNRKNRGWKGWKDFFNK